MRRDNIDFYAIVEDRVLRRADEMDNEIGPYALADYVEDYVWVLTNGVKVVVNRELLALCGGPDES